MSFVDLPVPHGKLEALHWAVEHPRAAAIVCHPHPLHGGTMHNHVTYRLAQAWRDAQVSCVRFNFRGVGRSTGAHDEGRGEVDDARAALDFIEKETPGVPLYASGFSFGSRTCLRLALDDTRITKVLAVGVAVDMYDMEFITALEKPVAFIHADTDEYGKLENLRALLGRLKAKHQLFVVQQSDHLCTGRLDAFSEQAKAAVAWLMAV
ncbi:MAG: alpha/beta fold hydrolase [Archangiaceae bacterium]|nr:alpha/beta fold hydrolase [Archangiaceae bacterium]